jgi:transposase
MKIKEVIGIDVGKLTNDVIIHSTQASNKFENDCKGIRLMLKWLIQKINFDQQEILLAFEHTGIYSFLLMRILCEMKFKYVVLPGLEIKRSLGIQRGKNDKIDAKRIATYAFQRKNILKPYKLPSKNLIEMRRLLSLREKIVVQRGSYVKNLNENKKFLKKLENRVLFEVQEKLIKELTKQIEKVEMTLDDIIKSDSQLWKLFELITSIKGVGKQTALFMIAYTNAFTLFDNWRKFASYAGTAPFPYQSGISIKGRTKVSHLANKKMKSLLNMCATSSIICNPEMKAYFEKRKAEGKNGMSTINIIRNKILARIFAVVNRGTPYVNTLGYVA